MRKGRAQQGHQRNNPAGIKMPQEFGMVIGPSFNCRQPAMIADYFKSN
jgi:hypothetical protein